MNAGNSIGTDPLIEEMRAIRRAISEQFGNDVDRLCDHLQELQRQHPDRIVEAAARTRNPVHGQRD